MLKLCRHLQMHEIPGDVGIEIEVEYRSAAPHSNNMPSGWQVKGDGSLRFLGKEFVTRNPIRISEVRDKVAAIMREASSPAYDPIINSPRSGVHVHVNVSSRNLLEIYNNITAYWLLENLFIKYCGEDTREGNNFCLRLCDSEGTLDSFIRDMKSTPFMALSTEIRYMSQNISSILKHLSLEYRGMRGTMDPEIITEWTEALWALSVSSATFPSPAHLFEVYENSDPEGILRVLLPGQNSFIENLKRIPNWNSVMFETLDILDRFVYAVNWDAFKRKWGGNTTVPETTGTPLGPTRLNYIPIPPGMQTINPQEQFMAAVDGVLSEDDFEEPEFDEDVV